MTNKAKKILMIIGLIVCMIISLLVKAEAGYSDNEATHKIAHPVAITQVIGNTGTQWIIQTMCKIFKLNQYIQL